MIVFWYDYSWSDAIELDLIYWIGLDLSDIDFGLILMILGSYN